MAGLPLSFTGAFPERITPESSGGTSLYWTRSEVEDSQGGRKPKREHLAALRSGGDVLSMESVGNPEDKAAGTPAERDRLRAAHDHQLAAIKAGDVDAFDTLCMAVAEPLWRFATKLTGSPDAGQDIVQDVLIDLWTRRKDVEITHSVTAYLFGAVRRRAFVHLRNAGTASRISAAWTPENIPAIGTIADPPDTQLERHETATLVRNAVASLPLVRRQAILLRWRDRLSYDDIAAALGISVDAARAHVSRGYRALREVLREIGVEGI